MTDSAGRPIPRRTNAPTADDYGKVPLSTESAAAQEPIVSLDEFGIAGESYYRRGDGLNAPYYRIFDSACTSPRARLGVAQRLLRANDLLEPRGLEVYVWDALRPVECQEELWIYFSSQVQKANPSGTPEQWRKETTTYCTAPDHPRPTHSTGGAVDLTLRRKATGEILYMGGIFDDPSPISHADHFETLAILSESDLHARSNRRLLFWSMLDCGFSNYAYEWWHYDFGTQMWVTNWIEAQGATPPKEAYYDRVTTT